VSDRLTAAQRGYGHKWREARLVFLKVNPLCVFCLQQDRVTQATVVDHIKPHKGDMHLMWSRNNWQSLCKLHHDSTKQRIENTGKEIGCTVDGLPIDARHHWYDK
jgi:5-methylcytosine-specific restriction protein A